MRRQGSSRKMHGRDKNASCDKKKWGLHESRRFSLPLPLSNMHRCSCRTYLSDTRSAVLLERRDTAACADGGVADSVVNTLDTRAGVENAFVVVYHEAHAAVAAARSAYGVFLAPDAFTELVRNAFPALGHPALVAMALA